MKIYLFAALLFLLRIDAIPQKKVIDNDSYKTWTHLGDAGISNNGLYVWYEYTVGQDNYNLVFSTADAKYKREFEKSNGAKFTSDSKHLIFKTGTGICILRTADKKMELINNAGSFTMPSKANDEWLSYHINNDIVLRNILTSEEMKFSNALSSYFNMQGSAFVVSKSNEIIWVSLKDQRQKIISQQRAQFLAFDASGQQLAFLASVGNNNNIYFFKDGMDSATLQVVNGLDSSSYKIALISPSFSQDGRLLFFKLAPVDSVINDTVVVTEKLDVWHFKDAYLQSNQLVTRNESKERKFTALINLKTSKLEIIEDRNTKLIGVPTNNYALISNVTNVEEAYWNTTQSVTYSLRSLKSNSSIKIASNPAQSALICISPSEKFVSWYDTSSRQYLTYEIATGDIYEITKDIPYPTHRSVLNRSEIFVTESIGWLPDDTAILVSDRFDIWQVDPRKKKKPICLTNGFGRNHNIVFRKASIPSGSNMAPQGSEILLAGLDEATKYNGLFSIKKGVQADPIPMGKMIPGVYYYPYLTGRSSIPIKAENTNIYLIRRMSTEEAPNLYITKDFNNLIPISNFKPQSKYNWVTSRLITFELNDGEKRRGILYSPENFDSTRKYPVILHYYEKKSDELYTFLNPDLSEGELSIPWYVSNGYLVFTPDIYYRPGHTGEDILKSVVSAAKCLFNFPWVDTSNVGLQGHSMGGYETNYIVTHSNMFKAAQSSAGISDLTHSFTSLGFGQKSLARVTTIGQLNMVINPWQDPEKYVTNSPIYNVANVTTPLLLMHNKSDDAVPFGQSVALFSALRMLQKPVWLLQYDGEGHILEDELCRLDFTIRQQQFFNHYLKKEPMPMWMSEGIPSVFKGIRSGLSLGKGDGREK